MTDITRISITLPPPVRVSVTSNLTLTFGLGYSIAELNANSGGVPDDGAYPILDRSRMLFVWSALLPAPLITVQPSAQTSAVDTTATYSVTALYALTYQWQLNSGAGWADIVGATSASYTTPTLAYEHTGRLYRVVITGEAGVTTSNSALLTVPPLGMPAGALGIWYISDFNPTRKAVPNAAHGNALQNIITRHPRGAFDTSKVGGEGYSGGWLGGGFGGCTITEKYATGRDGVMAASRAVFSGATTWGLKYRDSVVLTGGVSGAVFTMAIDAWTESGTVDFYMSKDGEATTATKTATTVKQRHVLEFNVPANTSMTADLRFCRPTTGNGTIIVDKAFLWEGNAASLPADLILQGDLHFGNSSRATITSVTGGEMGLTDGGVGTIDFNDFTVTDDCTVLAVVKRVGTYNNTAGYRYPFVYDVVESTTPNTTTSWSLGEYEGEGNLAACFGGRLLKPAPGFSPNLYADGQYHVISMGATPSALDLWYDDVGIAVNVTGTGTSMSCRKFQIGNSNATFGLVKFKLAALAIYPFKLTDAQRRDAVNSLIIKVADSGITITKPTNLLVGGIDSITVGPSNNSYLQQYLAAGVTPGKILLAENEAIGGSMLHFNGTPQLNFDVRLPYHIQGVPARSIERAGRRFICTIFAGANDLQPSYATDDEFLAELWGMTAQLRARGYLVGVATILPKSSAWGGYAAHNARRATANTKIRAAVGTHYDVLLDFAADPVIGPDAAASNVTLYSDGLHLTTLGQTNYLLPIYAAAINPILL